MAVYVDLEQCTFMVDVDLFGEHPDIRYDCAKTMSI